MNPIKIAIVGFGGIARVHYRAYEALSAKNYPIEIVAICEKDPSRIYAALDFNLGNEEAKLPPTISVYTDIREMIEQAQFDVADVCLPTFLHKDVSISLMRAGKHVLCEKPMALCYDDCRAMLQVAREMDVRLMIGQCERFDAAYRYLRDCIRSGCFGRLDNLYMDRHSVFPTWGADRTHQDTKKSGGCTLDTHIHDVDMARFLLGEPEMVSAVEFDAPPFYQAVTGTLFYPDTTVVANGSWYASYQTVFRVSYHARFEKACASYDGSEVWVVNCNGARRQVILQGEDEMEAEIAAFLSAVCGESDALSDNLPESAAESVRLIETLRESAKLRGEKIKWI